MVRRPRRSPFKDYCDVLCIIQLPRSCFLVRLFRSMPTPRDVRYRHRLQRLPTVLKAILLLFRAGLARLPKQRGAHAWRARWKQGDDSWWCGALDSVPSGCSNQCRHGFVAAISLIVSSAKVVGVHIMPHYDTRVVMRMYCCDTRAHNNSCEYYSLLDFQNIPSVLS